MLKLKKLTIKYMLLFKNVSFFFWLKVYRDFLVYLHRLNKDHILKLFTNTLTYYNPLKNI